MKSEDRLKERQEGERKGQHTKAIGVAKEMLKKNFPITFSSEYTWLSKEAVEELKDVGINEMDKF